MQFRVTLDILYGTQPPGPPHHPKGRLRHSVTAQIHVWNQLRGEYLKGTGTAVCSPEDEYDIEEGEILAITRALSDPSFGQGTDAFEEFSQLMSAFHEESFGSDYRDESGRLCGRFERGFDVSRVNGEWRTKTLRDIYDDAHAALDRSYLAAVKERTV